jgi:cytolysin (calcineurin-like family phosphatase)
MRHSIKIKKTTRNRLKELSALLDQYRVFYEQETDPKKVYKFLKDRYRKNQSTIYIALIYNKILGPTQLYPTYSTVSLEKFLILK